MEYVPVGKLFINYGFEGNKYEYPLHSVMVKISRPRLSKIVSNFNIAIKIVLRRTGVGIAVVGGPK